MIFKGSNLIENGPESVQNLSDIGPRLTRAALWPLGGRSARGRAVARPRIDLVYNLNLNAVVQLVY